MEQLANIFAHTLLPDKVTREAAERALGELAERQSDFLLQLIHFACQSTHDGAEGQRERSVCLAAAIHAHNVLRRGDWNRNPHFTEALKQAVRDTIVPLQCAPHVCDRVRRQMLAATAELVAYDFPTRWPGLMLQLSDRIGQCVTTLQGQPATTSALGDSRRNSSSNTLSSYRNDADATSELCCLKGALSVLRLCCKVYENPHQTDPATTDAFAEQLVPSLVDLCDFLIQRLWLPSLSALLDEAVVIAASPLTYADEGIFAVPAMIAEASHCVRLTLKCLWSLLSRRLPRCLCTLTLFSRYWLVCVDAVSEAVRQRVLPWSVARLTRSTSAATAVPPQAQCVCQTGRNMVTGGLSQVAGAGDCEHFGCFQASAVWRVVKWGEMIACKLTQEFAQPRQCERRVRMVATVFCEQYLCAAVQGALELVRWHAHAQPPLRLNSKAHIMALELLTAAVDSRRAYARVLQPVAEELMTDLLFPRLSFSCEDEELWASNPEEYVRRQMSPTGDLYSARVVCSGLLLTFAVPSHKYQDATLLLSFVQFVIDQLHAHVPAVVVAHGMVVSHDAARCVDAALCALYEFRKVLLQHPQLKEDVQTQFEPLLLHYVVPVLGSPIGFLRARAVLVLSVYSGSLQWSDAAAFQRMLRAVLALFSDAATPVRVQTCMAFSTLVRHPYARDVITPCIAELVGHYFQVMRIIDSEAVVRTLRKIIQFYNDTLARWALELTELLVGHFAMLLDAATGKYNAMENYEPSSASDKPGDATTAAEEDFANTLSAADELLETLITLVKALPTSPPVATTTAGVVDDVFWQIQHRVGPMLYVILSQPSGPAYSFMDAALRLVGLLLERSSGVAGVMWRLVPCLHHLARDGAADYLPLMLTPLGNYMSSDVRAFLLTPLSALCVVPPFTASLATLTPAQVVCDMCLRLPENVTLRPREMAALPCLLETTMQYCWCVQREDTSATVYAPIGALVTVLTPHAMRAAMAPRRCRSLSLLFANTVLSCLLADTAIALRSMSGGGDLASFVQCCYLPLVRPSEDGAAALRLRSHDRLLFVVTCTVMLRWLVQGPARSELLEEVGRTLCFVIDCAVLGRFAEEEAAVCDEEAAAHERWLRRRRANESLSQRQKGAASGASGAEQDSDEDAWSDEEDEETESDDDIASFYTGSAVDEEDDEGEDDDGAPSGRDGCGDGVSGMVATGDGQFQTMLRQAQAMQHHADLDDEEDGDEDDVLDEDDFDSPVDAVNAWQELLQVVDEFASSRASVREGAGGAAQDDPRCYAKQLAVLLRADDARWQVQRDAIVRAASRLEHVFMLRQERAGHA